MPSLPRDASTLIVGAGFAGAATAWALGRAGLGPGLILEQEDTWGVHASGRNAALLRLAESDDVVATLVARSLPALRALDETGGPLLARTGGLTLAGAAGAAELAHLHDGLRRRGLHAELLGSDAACARHPWLAHVAFARALWCADEGVVDIHALLGLYLRRARESGFAVWTGCRAEALIVEGGRVAGVRTPQGEVRAGLVIDAGGAWAGRLGAAAGAGLPLRPLRRHLFVSAAAHGIPAGAPMVWMEDASLYFRPESGGLLLSPCDESPAEPGVPDTHPSAAESLAEKIHGHVPGLADLTIRRSWACLRTFAPDRRPVVGPDPRLPGLFHVSGLGGFGMMCSAAIGELAADLVAGKRPAWIDPAAVAPFAGRPWSAER
ncbi:MAG: FAD-binding oxidoreductase [Acidobacteria bacterium]|nr:FAD-binding oxidoreductase [Acidobacteriota bacterium]